MPKKGGTETIFHAFGDKDRRGGYEGESSSSASCSVSESQCCAEAKLIHEGMEKDFRRAKDREGIPPFKAMLSLEQRRAFYLGTKIPKDQKGLRYQYQVMMVKIAPLKGSPGSLENRDKDI